MKERRDPLWRSNQVPHSCWVWSRQKYLWIVMTRLTKIFYCNHMENELKSYHNKTNWANLCGCRIPDCCWSRTVFHDERHWRILTIYRCSGLSWVHFAKRWKIIWTEGLDQREHQNCLQGKYGVEIRIMSVNKDNSYSWVRISHDLNKLVTDLNNNEQETSEMQFEECAFELNACDLHADQRPKQNHKDEILPAHPQELYLLVKELEPQDYSSIDYPVSKQLIHLLRHGSLPREVDGAIEFWRLKRLSSERIWAFSTLNWWKVEEHNGRKRRKQENISVSFWFFRNNSVPL